MTKEIEFNAKSIIERHGAEYFNLGEAAKIMRCNRNNVPYLLNEAGVSVKPVGAKKLVSAYDIAYAMAHSRISPVDNETRATELYRAG